MTRIRYTLVALLLVFSSAIASDLPLVSECEKPVYSLSQYDSDPELMLELAIKAYRECLYNVVISHSDPEAGSQSESKAAYREIERIELDQQAVWPQTEIVQIAQSTGLWTEDRSAAALSIPADWGTALYVVLFRSDAKPLVVNISRVGPALFLKLGLAPQSEYEKYEIQPVEWLEETESQVMLSVRLHAWRDGQRYTVSTPIAVDDEGFVIWQ